ncbi:MAG: hypothetical protein KKB37_04865 [Alphaproteobacteria bacterium]|nr:hypothetical protein [Alphaproteobacteria bacterium]
MMIRLGLAVLIATLPAFSIEARAQCAMDDFVCQSFSGSVAKNPTPTRRRTSGQTETTPTVAVAPPVPAVLDEPRRDDPKDVVKIVASQPPVNLTRLTAGAIPDAPIELKRLAFGSNDLIELAAAKCAPVERSTRRISCAVAVQRTALTGNIGAGCENSLALRQLEFVQSASGEWLNIDSIALCGGRLLRRTELFPVAVNGAPSYAMREDYSMLGGDQACAAPYLSSRMPLGKSYMPADGATPVELTCGTVSSR